MSASPPNPALATARARIADCLQCDAQGRLQQRRRHLNLAGLKLTDAELTARFDPRERGLPEISLADLPHLRYLDLTDNQLTQLPECVTECRELQWLGLNFNRLTTLPENLGQLGKLERLYLRGNALKALPEGMGGLTRLVELDLRGNQLAQPPACLLPLLDETRPAGAVYLDVAENGGEWSEIASAGDTDEKRRTTLASYLRQVQDDGKVLAQGKLLLVGEGGVGKTTLLDVLEGKKYNDHSDTTHGLELRRLEFQAPADAWTGTLHAWDFSGQPAMRQTHQLFFTSPALYLLVWNHREAATADEIIEWLTLIDQRTQGEGRVLLVAKKGKDREAEPPQYAEILRRFGPESKDGRPGVLLAGGCLKLDSEGRQAAEQLLALRAKIAEFAKGSASFNEKRPASWIKAQKRFREMRESQPYLRWEEFAAECRRAAITDAEQYAAAQHRLGTLVSVDTERLRNVELAHGEEPQRLVVLNPDWLSKAISFVIERDEKDQQNAAAVVPASPANVPPGMVSCAQMDALWRNPPQPRGAPPLVFPEKLFPFFRQLMRAFDFARPVRHGDRPDTWYLVPNRLRTEKSELWERAWRRDLQQVFWRVELRVENGDPLNHWLALAIFYRLMIVLHGEAQGRQEFVHAAHWRSGFMLAPFGGGMARIEFGGSDRRDAGRCVGFDLQVASGQPREIWRIFSDALKHVLRDLERHYGYTAMRPHAFVSCPASVCDRPASNRYWMPEDKIAEYAHEGKAGWRTQTTFCGVSGCKQGVIELGTLWDGSTGGGPDRLGRIEGKLDHLAAGQAGMCADLRVTRQGVERLERSFSEWKEDFLDLHQRLGARAFATVESVGKIQSGQEALARSLRKDMESLVEELTNQMRAMHRDLADGTLDLPRFYSLVPLEKQGFLKAKEWRLRLHCEKTGYPPAVVLPGTQGEFVIKESSDFLKAVAPYVKNVSNVLTALAPMTALLTGTDPVVAMTPAVVMSLFTAAKDLEKPVGSLEKLVKEEATSKPKTAETSGRPVRAENEALVWLHQFLVSVPGHEKKLGLVRKVDGQGRSWWVLPNVDV